jgi:hypothetical protein
MKIKELYENISNCLDWIKINNSDLKDIFEGAKALRRGIQVLEYDKEMIGKIDDNYFISNFIMDILEKNLPEYQLSLDMIDDILEELDIDDDTLEELDESEFENHVIIKNTFVDVKESISFDDYWDGLDFDSLLKRFEFAKEEIGYLL